LKRTNLVWNKLSLHRLKVLILHVSKILIVAATAPEIEIVSKHFNIPIVASEGLSRGAEKVSVLLTGVGMVNTAYWMGRFFENDFSTIINVGICGAFNRDLKIAELVQVTSDLISEMGAEDDESFIPFADLNLGGTALYHPKNNLKFDLLDGLKKVKAITVNKVHGNETNIKKIKALYQPDIESMEGAAFFRGCEHYKGNYLQIRSVSNYVEKRDKSKWNIPLAIQNLNVYLIQLIDVINA